MPATYEQDLHAWAIGNAALLRQGRSSEADLENTSEEPGAMRSSERHQLEYRLEILLSKPHIDALVPWCFGAKIQLLST